MDNILDQIKAFGVVPIAVIDNEEKAVPLANILLENGMPIIEVTLRTDSALRSIEKIAKECPKILLGAGTVLNVEDAQKAIDYGAKFIVSPGFNPKIVEYCNYKSVVVLPGVLTPTEIQNAVESGVKVLKLFPMESIGGLAYLKAVSAPFRDVKFIPTGGVNNNNLLLYLKHPKVLACAGSWIIPSDKIANGQFGEIADLVRQAIATILGFNIYHIGINSTSAEDARIIVNQLQKIFPFENIEKENSIFIGSQVEVMKRAYLGQHGHIAIATNFIDRAIAYLANRGIGIKPETKNEENGKLRTVYLDVEIGGFAVHLIQI